MAQKFNCRRCGTQFFGWYCPKPGCGAFNEELNETFNKPKAVQKTEQLPLAVPKIKFREFL